MDSEIAKWLHDILQAIDEIESFYVDKPKVFEEFVNDIKTKRAIERDLEIIGEAVNRILRKDSGFEILNAKNIIGTRNRIIHGYDSVSDDMIWSIVIKHIPKLRAEIERLIRLDNS
jgi:uncharacterized protein with HEPN domain